MTRLQPWGESSHGSVKENCVGELFCIPAAPRTPVPLNPCGRTGRLSDRCILCNPSVVSLCHRSKEESLRLKAKRRRCESRGESRGRSEEHTSELQSHSDLVCRLLLEKKKKKEKE